MDLFILRHGKAGKSSPGPGDAARALTRKGKDEIKQVAQWMKMNTFRFDLIATSPLQRAHETASIVAYVLGQKKNLTIWDTLAPGGDPETLCSCVLEQESDATVLIVGHEPLLSRFIGTLISGHADTSILVSKGGLAKIRNCSTETRPRGELQWLLTPAQIAGMR